MPAQDDFNALSSFVEWLGLEGDEAEEFVKQAMTRRGHKPATSWVDGDGKNKDSGSNVLGLRTGGKTKASGGGSGWQYGS